MIGDKRRYADFIADEEIPLDVASEILDKAVGFVDVVSEQAESASS